MSNELAKNMAKERTLAANLQTSTVNKSFTQSAVSISQGALQIEDMPTVVERSGVLSGAFVLGHPTYGVLGTSTLGGTLTYSVLEIINPNNIWKTKLTAKEMGFWTDDSATIPISQWRMNDDAASTTVTDSVGTNNGAANANTNTLKSLVGWWKLNKTTGTTISDSSVNANDGTSLRDCSITTVPGKVGTALDFQNSMTVLNDDVIIPDANAYSVVTTGELSVSVWFYVDNLPASSYTHILGKSVAGGHEWAFRIQSTGAINSICWALDGTPEYSNIVTSLVTTGQWNHLVMTVKDGELKSYLNGTLAATNNSLDITELADGAGDVYLGTRESDVAGTKGFDGKLDDFRIYDRVLTLSEVSGIYNANNGEDTNSPDLGKINGTLQFDGVATNVDLGDDTDFEVAGDDFTIAAWIKLDSLASSDEDYVIFSKWKEAGDQREYRFYVRDDDNVLAFDYTTDGTAGDTTTVEGSTVLATDTWYHVMVERSSDTFKVYLNTEDDTA